MFMCDLKNSTSFLCTLWSWNADSCRCTLCSSSLQARVHHLSPEQQAALGPVQSNGALKQDSTLKCYTQQKYQSLLMLLSLQTMCNLGIRWMISGVQSTGCLLALMSISFIITFACSEGCCRHSNFPRITGTRTNKEVWNIPLRSIQTRPRQWQHQQKGEVQLSTK